jgi:hypothetical protein
MGVEMKPIQGRFGDFFRGVEEMFDASRIPGGQRAIELVGRDSREIGDN